jgi:hypothetical protein
MGLPFLPPPTPEELRTFTPHELVRDYPELLALVGPIQGEAGTRTVSEMEKGQGLLPEALAFLSWREGLTPSE